MTTPIPETPPHGSTWLEAVGILRANALACPHCADDKARPDPCTCTCHSDYVRAVTPIDAPDAAELATLGRQNAERELVRVGEALEHERSARIVAETERDELQNALEKGPGYVEPALYTKACIDRDAARKDAAAWVERTRLAETNACAGWACVASLTTERDALRARLELVRIAMAGGGK